MNGKRDDDAAKIEAFIRKHGVTKCPAPFTEQMRLYGKEQAAAIIANAPSWHKTVNTPSKPELTPEQARERSREATRKWREKNKEKKAAYGRERHSRLRQETGTVDGVATA